MKAIIAREIGEETMQSILKISERFINLAGVFGDSSTSGVFIKLMCRYCMPTGHRSIGQRHVQINKMILSTANCLGSNFKSYFRSFQHELLGHSLESSWKLQSLLQPIPLRQGRTASIKRKWRANPLRKHVVHLHSKPQIRRQVPQEHPPVISWGHIWVPVEQLLRLASQDLCFWEDLANFQAKSL